MRHNCLALAVPPRQTMQLDSCSKLGLLCEADIETEEPCPVGAKRAIQEHLEVRQVQSLLLVMQLMLELLALLKVMRERVVVWVVSAMSAAP